MMKKAVIFIIASCLGTNVFADLPIDAHSPLNWKNDLTTLRNEANKEIYYWDILALLVPEQLSSVAGERKYGLRTTGPSQDELLDMMKGVQTAVMHLNNDEVNQFFDEKSKNAVSLGDKGHINRLKCLANYMKEVADAFSSDIYLADDYEPDTGENRNFLKYIGRFAKSKEAELKAQHDLHYTGIQNKKKSSMNSVEHAHLQAWKLKNSIVSKAPLQSSSFVPTVVESPFDGGCTYENLVRDPLWSVPPQSTRDAHNPAVQNFAHPHYLDNNWNFSANPNGVYTFRGTTKPKLVTVFGSPDTFEDASHHINKYGFLSNYWSTASYAGKNYTLPVISSASSRVRITVQKSNGSVESYDFDHVEGPYHFGKLLLAGHIADRNVFLGKSPYETQQAARGKGPNGKASEWDKLMFELLKQKFTRNLSLKNELKELKDAILVEGNYRGQNTDKNWGVEYDKDAGTAQMSLTTGDNKLGRMLMSIARQLDSVPDDMEINETIIEEYTLGQYRVVSGKTKRRG